MANWTGASVILGEAVDPPGARRRWRATVDGRPAEAVEAALASEAEAAQVAERLRRLSAHPDDSLRPVHAYGRDGRTVWVATDGDPGPSLDGLLEGGALTPREAAAVGWTVLGALQALHGAGVAHGSLGPGDVHVDATGRVRMGGHWFNPARRATTDDLLGDIEAAGALTCAALGIPLHPDPEAGPTAAEREAPALTRTVRAIASGASGANVSGARMALTATAGSLVEPSGIAHAAGRLGARVRGEAIPEEPPLPTSTPRPTEAPPPIPAPVAPASTPPASEPPRAVPASTRYIATAADFQEAAFAFSLGRLTVPLLVVGGLLVFLALVWGAVGLIRHTPGRSPVAATSHPAAPAPVPPSASARASAAPTPTPTPTASFGPASAPPIQSIEVATSGACAAGASCAVEVTVHTTTASSSVDIAWTVKAYDSCTGQASDVGQNKVTERSGWNTVIGDNVLTLPAGRGLQLVAVTTAPATAASRPLPVGGSGC